MFKTQRSRSATSNYLDVRLPGGLILAISQHHDDVSLTVALRDDSDSRRLRLTAFKSTSLTVGGGVTLSDGDEEPLQVSVYLGKLALVLSARGRYGHYEHPKPEGSADATWTGPPIEIVPPGLVRRLVRALVPKNSRRKLSATLDYFDTETPEGAELRARAVLWDDDTEYRAGNLRQPSVSLTHLLWGKPVQGKDEAIETREVTVGMPEGPFTMTARLMQRVVSWPRWPLRKLYRWVSFSPAAMLVPMKNSDRMQYEGNGTGCTASVSGTSFSAAIGELVRRVHRARDNYGGRSWAPRPTPHHRESHRVAFSHEKPARGQDSTAGGRDLFHGDTVWIGQAYGTIILAPLDQNRAVVAALQRDPLDGGVVLTKGPATSDIAVDGVPLGPEPRKVWPGSTVRIGGLRLVIHFDPIGPRAPLQQLEIADIPAGPEEQVASDVAEVAASMDTSPPSADEVVVPSPEDYELPIDEEKPVDIEPAPELADDLDELPVRPAAPMNPAGWQGD